jgi:lysosomal acid lipase/cholesteryl ester hydrolase
MTTPTVLFSGSHDTLASPLDVKNLKKRVKNIVYEEEIQGWNHADFLFGVDAPNKLYSKIVRRMNDVLAV